MNNSLLRVGTTYIPVKDAGASAEWYAQKLGAVISYQDDEKAIINLANQSFFLVKAKEGETANFIDANGRERFSMTFEVDGMESLETLHREFTQNGIQIGEIEDRGHAGRNFVFEDLDGNRFDVWSELSPDYKKRMQY
ncbi:VOC family protein [Falsibacillus pallidus]|uniref:Catechol 2,3-dioxygenase-like lactoylglutathione lyase family enzyme n=1 Tax=Falsibacillus pallidus TaxID=493781 RepID=A0A370G813_9BACI|nr:VOC family protein [Falsibacillus pallidus]RDI39928.1 catechol 2,3-dioxygenase-like lactoylglutathione lyase family enzyme [Falsibacillus pallidus]